jgi:predicted HAD superfamily Cof-like phosphohydrolase
MIKDVLAFQEATNQFDTHKPEHNFYHRLIKEEFTELFDAVAENDEVEEFDACLDLIYVVIGHMIQRGWDAQGGWNEVQRSNMAKVDPDTGHVHRREDGKILKPAGWTPPDLTPFLTKEN